MQESVAIGSYLATINAYTYHIVSHVQLYHIASFLYIYLNLPQLLNYSYLRISMSYLVTLTMQCDLLHVCRLLHLYLVIPTYSLHACVPQSPIPSIPITIYVALFSYLQLATYLQFLSTCTDVVSSMFHVYTQCLVFHAYLVPTYSPACMQCLHVVYCKYIAIYLQLQLASFLFLHAQLHNMFTVTKMHSNTSHVYTKVPLFI